MRGPSLAAASGGHPSSRCVGLSLSRPLLLQSTGSRRTGSAVVAHGPSCSAACGILPDQGSNPRPLRWQADSQPPRHQGSPTFFFFTAVSPVVNPPKFPLLLTSGIHSSDTFVAVEEAALIHYYSLKSAVYILSAGCAVTHYGF